MRTKIRCPICGASTLVAVRNKLRYDIEREVLQCRKCSVQFLKPRTNPKQHADTFYDGEYRKRYTPVLGKTLNPSQYLEIYRPLNKLRLDLFKKYLTKDSSVLEIGSAVGGFLSLVKPLIAHCEGIELNRQHAAFCTQRFEINVFTDRVENLNLQSGQYDIIFAFEVLEHIENPTLFLQTLSALLRKRGRIVIEVPNLHDVLLKVYKCDAYGDFWYREPHVFYYSPRSLKALLRNVGLRVNLIRSIQTYSIFNHFHWLFKNEPMKAFSEAVGIPSGIFRGEGVTNIQLIRRVLQLLDKHYRGYIESRCLGNYLVAIAQKG